MRKNIRVGGRAWAWAADLRRQHGLGLGRIKGGEFAITKGKLCSTVFTFSSHRYSEWQV